MVAIKGMEMPSYCLWDCPLAREDGGACQLADVRTSGKERPKDCPLVEIATCKDCKHCYPDEDGRGYHCERDSNVRFSVHKDFYCADAESEDK